MSLPVSLRARAEADLTDAFAWYEETFPGLGAALLRSVDGCFARIQRHPEAYPPLSSWHPRHRPGAKAISSVRSLSVRAASL